MSIARFIDQTLLKPDRSEAEVIDFIRRSKKYPFAAIFVLPKWVTLACEELKDTKLKVGTVVGFPFGANKTEVKVKETQVAVEDGAKEIDMVIDIGGLKSGDYERVLTDIKEVVAAADGRLVKVIIETAYLTEREKIKACELIIEGGAHFVKTSTGYGPTGATVDDVRLLRRIVGNRVGVKASGGIRTYAQAMDMLRAGASRIGTSTGIEIVEEEHAKSKGDNRA